MEYFIDILNFLVNHLGSAILNFVILRFSNVIKFSNTLKY